MGDAKLDRVREDLAVMRRAAGLGLPFEWEHVWSCVALAVVGVGIAAVSVGTGISVRPSVPGSGAHLAYVALLLVPVALAFGVMGLVARRRREVAPLFWRELRLAAKVALVAVPLVVLFVVSAIRGGLSAGTLTAATLFLAGLFGLVNGLTDTGQRYTLGFAVATMLAGLAAPWATYETAGLLAGGWLIVGGLSSALIMARLLGREVAHAD